MSIDPPDFNPYEAPEAEILDTPLSESADLAAAEAIRRKYLNHEASIRSIGSLQLIGAVFSGLSVIGIAVGTIAGGLPTSNAFIIIPYIAITYFNYALGQGIRRLKVWARWVMVVLTILPLLGVLGFGLILAFVGISGQNNSAGAIGGMFGGFLCYGAIPTYILYLFLSKKGAYVFSPEYRQIINLTPHVKYKTSCLLKGLLVVIVVIIVVVIVAAVFGVGR